MEKSLRKKIVAAVLTFMLVMSAVMALFFMPSVEDYRGAQSIGIRFKQVVLGENFAVGLTYNGELYGWDTVELPSEGTNAMGTRYGVNPRKIAVAFVKGPVVSGGTIKIDNTPVDDEIVKIAATRTSAAFITKKNNIYTWGRDALASESGGYGILLRSTRSGVDPVPTIIDYALDAVSGNTALSAVKAMVPNVAVETSDSSAIGTTIPTGEGSEGSLYDIVGGDNNYVIKHRRGTPNAVYYFGWGSSKYLTTRAGSQNNSDYVTAQFYDFHVNEYENVSSMTDMTVGGGAVLIANGNDLYLRGKNYYIPAIGDSDTYEYKTGKTRLNDGSAENGGYSNDITDILYLDTMLDLKTGDVNQDGGIEDPVSPGYTGKHPFTLTDRQLYLATAIAGSDVYYAVNEAIANGKANGTALPYEFYGIVNAAAVKNSVASFYDSSSVDAESPVASVRPATLSLGNGYGYFIDSDGKLCFFGNGYNGQSGTADNKAYKSVTQITGFVGTPLSVVAGKTSMGEPLFKEMSSGSPNINNNAGKLTVTVPVTAPVPEGSNITIDKSQFAAFADGSEFISGMITEETGVADVYVWNSSNGFTSLKDKFKDLGITGSRMNRIVSLSGGYGNCLVALSSYGKIYQIKYDTGSGEFKVELKDKFYDSNTSAPMKNYTVNNSNRIDFAISNGRPGNSDERQMTDRYVVFTLDSKENFVESASEGSTITKDSLTAGTTVFEPVISENISGDAFRILRADDINLNNRTFVSSKLVSEPNTDVPSTGAPKFYFKGDAYTAENEISPEILKHYFDYSVDKDTEGNVSVKIIPYESTKEETIVMRYYIGRFVGESDRIKSHDADYLFYDIDVVTTEITIANTAAKFNLFNNKIDGVSTNNISIPVLDPNNTASNSYSIALTNVQFGLEKLAAHFSVDDAEAFKAFVIDEMHDKDSGFPAVAKISEGHLERYYDAAAASGSNYSVNTYYNDKYQYIAFDSDGDTLNFDARSFMPLAGAQSYFGCTVEDIVLDIPLTGSGFVFSSTLDSNTLPNFDNVYGLTLNVQDGHLLVSYKVVRLSAKASTSNLTYEDNDISKAQTNGDINDLPRYTLAATEIYYDSQGERHEVYSPQEQPIIVPAYVQASMRTNIKDENGEYYRAEEGHNVYNYPAVTRTVGAENENDRKFTFTLGSGLGLFNDYTNIFLTFAVNRDGNPVYNAYGDFVKQFYSDEGNQVSDENLSVVSLNSTTFTFESKVPASYTVQIQVRRFADRNMVYPIVRKDGSDEMITIVFNLTFSPSAFQNTPMTSLAQHIVNTETDYDITRFINAIDTAFVTCESSDSEVATVEIINGGKSLRVTPRSSGSVTIIFTIKQYVLVKAGSFKINVESRTIMDRTVSLLDSESIPLADFKLTIAQTVKGNNAFNFNEYSLDKTESYAPNGYYFVKKREETSQNSIDIWDRTDKPAFIDSVDVEKDITGSFDDTIVLTAGQYESNTDFGDIMLVVKFIGTGTNAKKFEAAIPVTAAKRSLHGDDGQGLVIDVHVNRGNVVIGEGGIGSKGSDGDFRITLTDLLTAGHSNITPPANYRIQLVRASNESTFDYFDVSQVTGTEIAIKPTRSVSVGQQVDVSIYNSNSSSERYVLSFNVTVSGITEVLSRETYITIWLSCAAVVLVIMLIVFIIRMGVYWKKKAEQRRIIRKNQMLIKMRDRVHGKSDTNRQQLVQTKLKLEDPKYAKMFNERKKALEEQNSSINLDDSPADKKSKKKGKDKKKNGKKSLEELRAELDAKKEAFAKMQMGEQVQMPVADIPVEPDFGFGVMPDADTQMNDKINADDNILFDVETLDDNN